MEDEIVAHFHAYLLTERRVAHNTFVAYQKDLEQLCAFLTERSLSLSRATSVDLKQFIEHLVNEGISRRTIARKISCIKLLYQYAHQRYQWKNEAHHLVFPIVEKRLPRFLSEEQVDQLLASTAAETSAQGVRNKVMIFLLYATGIRITELVMLTKQQILWDTNSIVVHGKGGKDRTIPLPDTLVELLRTYITTVQPRLSKKITTDYLFPLVHAKTVKPMTRQAFWLLLKKVALKSGAPSWISPHIIRHSFATHLLSRGVNLRALQLLLGHEQIDTVQVYTHIPTTYMRKLYDKKHPRS